MNLEKKEKQFLSSYKEILERLFNKRVDELKEIWASSDDANLQEEAWKAVQENKNWITIVKSTEKKPKPQTQDTGV